MLPQLKPIAETLIMNTGLFTKAFEGVSEQQSHKQFSSDTNNLTWLLAHVVSNRFFMMELLGSPRTMPWQGQFLTKSIATIDPNEFPSLSEIGTVWSNISENLMSRLTELTEQHLAAEPSTTFPTSEKTLLATLAFLAHNETYHIGQVSFVRRLLRQEGLYKLLYA